MSIMKNLGILVPTLLVLSCSKVDKYSSIGSDIIGAIDSSAVAFDGTFNTDSIVPTIHIWGSSAKDSLSGLHRYQDSLSRQGLTQTEIFLGNFQQEESWGYFSFSYNNADSLYTVNDKYDPNSATDLGDSLVLTDTVESLSKEIYKLLAESNSDSVKTSLVFVIDTNRAVHDNYSLELSTASYFPDSTRIDTTKRHVIQHALIPSHLKSTVIDLPYTFYNSNPGDTIDKIITSGLEERNCSLFVQTRHIKFSGDSVAFDTTFALKDSVYTESLTFSSSEISPYYYFLDIDSGITAIDSTTSSKKYPYEYKYYYFEIDTIIVDSTNNSADTVHVLKDSTMNDTVQQRWASTTVIDTSYPIDSTVSYIMDTLNFSKNERIYNKIVEYDVLDSIYTNGIKEYITYDSIVRTFDTLKQYFNVTVSQEAKKYKEIIDIPASRSSSFTLDDSTALLLEALDTMNIMVKNISEDSTSLLPISGVFVKLTGYTNNGENKSEKGILPRYSSMQVFNKGAEYPVTTPFTSGGQEKFVRLKLGTDTFWNTMLKNRYLTISEANVELPLKSVTLPDYAKDGKLTVKYLVTSRLYTTFGDLLKHSYGETSSNESLGDTEKRSSKVQIHEDSLYVQLNLTNQLTDFHYTYNLPFKDGQSPLDTYLYIWVDGSDMAHILFDVELKYALNYIVQSKLK